MNNLSKVYVFKIFATVVFWCIPLLLFPAQLLSVVGFPVQDTYMFVRLLGWAYLALCVGYFFGLQASLKNQTLESPLYVGIVSNGGACVYLLYYGISGSWSTWGGLIQFIAWSSIIATMLITSGLYYFGIRSLSK